MRFSSYPPGLLAFLQKLGIFALSFILVTGILGPWIISTKLLYGYGFFIYGNMGKMVLFSLLAFIIFTHRTLPQISQVKYAKSNMVFFIVMAALMYLFFPLAQLLLKEQSAYSNIPLLLITHLVAVAIPATLVCGVFGIAFLRMFLARYRTELFLCLALSVGFYFAIFQIWKMWEFFSGIVLVGVKFLLSLHVREVREVGPLTLFVSHFAVRIEQACSGIDSIFLFSALYLLVGLVDWKAFDKVKLIGMFFPALIGLLFVNIVRVYLLILVGVYIDPKYTLQLFHTYLGMVLFFMYFGIFWLKTYQWMLKKKYV